MKTWIVPPLLALSLALPVPWEGEPPEWLLPWLYNPRERTQASREAFDEGRFPEAVEAAETAHRLAPEDPRTELNLGTSLLAAERTEEALESLTRAAERLEADLPAKGGPPKARKLASTAHYNRGSALLASDDPAAAVEAYEQALRRNPDHLDAKHNLEVALERLRQQQQQQQRQQQQQPPQGEDGEQPHPTPSPEVSEDQGPQQPPEEPAEGAPESSPPPQGDSRLPRFEDQPDMSAQEAAAILEAVENLERQQRRREAAERARNKARGEKDW